MLTGLKRNDKVLKAYIAVCSMEVSFVYWGYLSWLALEWYYWTINVFKFVLM